jgi:hypothetical protein
MGLHVTFAFLRHQKGSDLRPLPASAADPLVSRDIPSSTCGDTQRRAPALAIGVPDPRSSTGPRPTSA